MGLSWQIEFSAPKMSKILLRVKAHVHRSKMDVAPGSLDRMGRGEAGGATAPGTLAFSPDGKHVATGSAHAEVLIWELKKE